jgi:hypothetical protein
MSSIIDKNIIQHRIRQRRTIHFFIDLALEEGERNIDLTDSQFGNLDFNADEIRVKYVGFQSQHTNHDDLATFNCNFIVENTTLCPFVSSTSLQAFHDLRYVCKKNFDKRNVKIWVESIVNNQEGTPTVNRGNVMVAVEFIRYLRCDERVIW